MHYSEIKEFDIADGPGVRVALFVSGCPHHCRGCFNECTWDYRAGRPFTKAVEDRIINSCRRECVAGLSLLGGEPLDPANQPSVLGLLERFRSEVPGKTVWAYTGYVYEDLLEGGRARTECTGRILGLLDVLVDGPFVMAKKSIALSFRGSSNQRVIDVPRTLRAGKVVAWAGLRDRSPSAAG